MVQYIGIKNFPESDLNIYTAIPNREVQGFPEMKTGFSMYTLGLGFAVYESRNYMSIREMLLRCYYKRGYLYLK